MQFETVFDVDAPPTTVWAVMSEVERWHEWTPSIRRIRRFDRGPFRVGSRALVRQPKFPPAVWTVTALEPGRSFTWKSGAPGMWVHGYHGLVPRDGGARVTLGLRYEGPLGRLLARMTEGITRRYVAMEADGLKRRSEALSRPDELFRNSSG